MYDIPYNILDIIFYVLYAIKYYIIYYVLCHYAIEVFCANSLASIGRDLRRDQAPDLGAILV